MNRKEKYDDFDEWETDVFRAGATQVLEVGENIFYAIRTPNNKPVQSDADGMFDLRSRRGREVMKTATTIGGWAGGSGEIYRHIVARAGKARPYTNPRDARSSSRKENYDDFDEWERDAFAAGATQIVKLGDGFAALRTKDGSMVKVDAEGYFDPRSRDAIKNRKNRINIGAWLDSSSDGIPGVIYRHIIKNHPEFYAYENPLKPRKGESSRDFVSRCMSEEKTSFPAPKQRIAVCLSKSRRRNPVYDTGSDE